MLAFYAVPLIVVWTIYLGMRKKVDTHSRSTQAEAKEAGLTEPASLHPLIDPVKCLGCGACVRACPEVMSGHHVLGIIDDKATYIEKLKSKRQKYDGIIHSNVRVKVFGGDTAVLTARMRMHGTNQSGPFDDQLLLIHVWVKVNGAWQLAAHQTTKLQ